MAGYNTLTLFNKYYCKNVKQSGERGSLRKMKARICPSGKLSCLWTFKTIETVYKGQ